MGSFSFGFSSAMSAPSDSRRKRSLRCGFSCPKRLTVSRLFIRTMNIISIGEVLWDVFENAEHIGGATFNFSAHAALLGHNVVFVSAVGEDDRGQRALGRMDQLGLSTRHVRRTNEVATGHVTV